MTILGDLLTAAVEADLILAAYYDAMHDAYYSGQNVKECMEALEACDEMKLALTTGGYTPEDIEGWALIIPELDDEEQIADYSGRFITDFTKRGYKCSGSLLSCAFSHS